MICSDLYTRRRLLGNGDDGRRCRDAHKERRPDHRGKLQGSTQKAGYTRFKSNQVPLIPASRGHNYATTYPRLFPGPPPPPFFFNLLAVRCAQTNNSTALRLFPPLRCAQHCPIPPDLPIGRSHLSRLAMLFICSVIPVPSSHAPGTDRVPFARDFRLEARGGTRGFGQG